MAGELAAAERTPSPRFAAVIPQPLAQAPERGAFALRPTTRIVVRSTDADARRVGALLAGRLRPSTGFRLPVTSGSRTAADGDVVLILAPGDRSLGDEGYRLVVERSGVTL